MYKYSNKLLKQLQHKNGESVDWLYYMEQQSVFINQIDF